MRRPEFDKPIPTVEMENTGGQLQCKEKHYTTGWI
jgi:hypothetical protein